MNPSARPYLRLTARKALTPSGTKKATFRAMSATAARQPVGGVPGPPRVEDVWPTRHELQPDGVRGRRADSRVD